MVNPKWYVSFLWIWYDVPIQICYFSKRNIHIVDWFRALQLRNVDCDIYSGYVQFGFNLCSEIAFELSD